MPRLAEANRYLAPEPFSGITRRNLRNLAQGPNPAILDSILNPELYRTPQAVGPGADFPTLGSRTPLLDAAALNQATGGENAADFLPALDQPGGAALPASADPTGSGLAGPVQDGPPDPLPRTDHQKIAADYLKNAGDLMKNFEDPSKLMDNYLKTMSGIDVRKGELAKTAGRETSGFAKVAKPAMAIAGAIAYIADLSSGNKDVRRAARGKYMQLMERQGQVWEKRKEVLKGRYETRVAAIDQEAESARRAAEGGTAAVSARNVARQQKIKGAQSLAQAHTALVGKAPTSKEIRDRKENVTLDEVASYESLFLEQNPGASRSEINRAMAKDNPRLYNDASRIDSDLYPSTKSAGETLQGVVEAAEKTVYDRFKKQIQETPGDPELMAEFSTAIKVEIEKIFRSQGKEPPTEQQLNKMVSNYYTQQAQGAGAPSLDFGAGPSSPARGAGGIGYYSGRSQQPGPVAPSREFGRTFPPVGR